MMKTLIKYLRLQLWAFVFCGVLVAIYVYLQTDPVIRLTYVTAAVAKGKLRDTVTATGAVNAVVTVEVGSQLSGQLSEILVDYNDTVKRGDVVARLDKQSYEARRAEAHASLEMAKSNVAIKVAELERATADLEDTKSNLAILQARRDGAAAKRDAAEANRSRLQTLSARGVISKGDIEAATAEAKFTASALREAEAVLDTHEIKVAAAAANDARQEADLANARANIPQKEALLNLADVELERTVIRSPIDGIVIKRNVSQGQTVAASLEAPTLFTIAQSLAEMELHASVDETDIGKIAVGQRAQFSVDAFPGVVFSGVTAQIRKAPEVVQNVVTYTVVIKTQNDQLLLLPGMTASIEILVMESEEVLKIPSAALSFRPSAVTLPAEDAAAGEATGLVWVRGPSAVPTPVKVVIGGSDRSATAVLSGDLKAGDEVITTEIASPPPRSFLGIRIGF